jgi:2-phosphosulfolactate phosphatase
MPEIDLYTLPKDASKERLKDATVIVIDLLRASTTICTALAAGAECVMPFAEIDETLAAAEKFGRGNVLLGGERHGKVIFGFDLGNSPAEYTPERVAGRRILFTTTNGARALHHARGARRVLVGAAVNRAAIAQAVRDDPGFAILCAGTDGQIADEDVLAGGAIIESVAQVATNVVLDDNAAKALGYWRGNIAERPGSPMTMDERFAWYIEAAAGGRNLIDIGQGSDLPLCARLDVLTVVPELNAATGELRPA